MSWYTNLRKSPLLKSYVHKSSALVMALVIGVWFLAAISLYLFGRGRFTAAGQFGDSFGVLNSLTTVITFAALWISIRIQREEFLLTKDELGVSRRQTHMQVFETTFFNLLQNLRLQMDTYEIHMKDSGKTSHGMEGFNVITNFLNQQYDHYGETIDITKKMNIWAMTTPTLDQFFLCLDVLLKHVIKFDPKRAQSRLPYNEIVASSLTRPQVALVKMALKYSNFKPDRKARLQELIDSIS